MISKVGYLPPTNKSNNLWHPGYGTKEAILSRHQMCVNINAEETPIMAVSTLLGIVTVDIPLF